MTRRQWKEEGQCADARVIMILNNKSSGRYSEYDLINVLSSEELACVVNTDLSTLLYSGASSHIIKDLKYFWNYDFQGTKSVKTANHGTLSTLASGDCVAMI